MSLGVLNNINAVYAENNLNNTSNSLSKVLNELSSGSKINSGADDAAGLSLVNGLQANSVALAQSQTNAAEGVGLLKVADGALSQVTNLLNRAVTLATEASNGTLNGSQDMAANQEYQSILSEINNIGATTTYNNQTVFGASSPVNIYTGDSSTAGASIDALNIRSLSSSNVGDSGGVMSYSNGQNNVFLNLSSSSQNAAATDALNGGLSGSTTLNVNYLVKGANGAQSTATTAITVGGSSNYANTANGLINAINNAGLGLTATFATQSDAGVQGGGTQTGIEIAGGLVSAGVDPSASSTSGVLNPSGIAANELLTQNQQVNITVGGTSAASITINSSITNLSQLANAINFNDSSHPTTQNSLVTATVVTNSDGSQSLSLASAAGKGALSVTTPGGTSSISPVFANGGVGTSATSTSALSTVNTSNATGQALTLQQLGTLTVGVGSVDAAGADSNITGSFVVTNTSSGGTATTETFIMGGSGGTDAGGTGTYSASNKTFTVNGNTLADLRAAIQGQKTAGAGALGLGVDAALTSTGMTLTGATGTTVAATTSGVSYTNTLTGAEPAVSTGAGATANIATIGVAQTNQSSDVLSGSIKLTNGTVTETFQMGTSANSGSGTGSLVTSTGIYTVDGNTLGDLVNAINSQAAASNNVSMGLGAQASYGAGGLTFASQSPTTQVSIGNVNTLTNVNSSLGFYTPALTQQTGEMSTALLAVTNSSGTAVTGTIGASDNLTGQITLSNGGVTDTFIMGTNSHGTNATGLDSSATLSATGGNTYYVGNGGASALATAINSLVALESAGSVTTGINLAATAGASGGIYLQGTVNTDTALTVTASTLAVAQSDNVTTGVQSGNAAAPGTASTVTIGSGGSINTSDVFTGSITLVNTPQSGSAVTETFTMGGTAHSGNGAGTLSGTTFTVNGNTLADLQNAINSQQSAGANSLALGLTSSASTSGLSVSTSTNNGNTVSVSTTTGKTDTLVDQTTGTKSTLSMGTFASLNDAVSGNLAFTVGGSAKSITLTSGETVQGMIDQINGTTTSGGVTSSTYANGVIASWVPPSGGANFGSVLLTAVNPGENITAGTESVADTPTAASLSYTASNAYNTGLSSTAGIADSTSGQSAATFSSDAKASSSVATISYSDGAGQSLSASDLSNATDAQSTLTALNNAITAVAAQDGYIGAQINTLNAVSSVLSTQAENVSAAQNAVQATDYAAATSDMSKYEILSQTGISALAQANSLQQEVTKLLQ